MIGRDEFIKKIFGSEPYLLTSDYGPRWGKIHRGNDYITPKNRYAKLYAPCNSVVTAIGWNSIRGYYIELLVTYLGKTRYVFLQHLLKNSIKVREGQRIKAGSLLAQIGSTGYSTGPHLHIEFTLVSYKQASGRIPMPPFNSDKYGAGFYANFSWPVYPKLTVQESGLRVRTYPDVDDAGNIIGYLDEGKVIHVYDKKTADGFTWARLDWVEKEWSAIREIATGKVFLK